MSLLTPEELHELTDCARKGGQIEWLRARSWVFEVSDTGRPKVDREEYARHMIGGQRIETVTEEVISTREWMMQRVVRRLEGQGEGLERRNERWRKRLIVYPLDQLRGLPSVSENTNVSGVYFLWIGPLLWYIGQANVITVRIRQHIDSGKHFTRATYLPVHRDWKKEVEADHVARYRPRDNRTNHG